MHSSPAVADGIDLYAGLGHVVRAMHDALSFLGADNAVAEAASEFPSARERLSHIATLTERAANTVLGKVEDTIPIQQSVATAADAIDRQWDSVVIENLSKEELQELARQTRAFISHTRTSCSATHQALSDIMISQDFQDLTGQLIKKVVTLIERTETDLLQLLIDGAPAGTISGVKKDEMLAGPGAIGGVLMDQGNVDDLLADLGF